MGKTFAPTHDYLAVLARVFGTPRNLLVAGLHIPSYSLYYIGQTPYFWTSSVLSISMLLLFFAEILDDQITSILPMFADYFDLPSVVAQNHQFGW